jgi:hypothetical protein
MEQLDYSNFPDLELVQNRIEKLKSFKWPQFSVSKGIEQHIAEIRKILCDNFSFFPNLLCKHSGEIELPFKFFRVRPLETFTGSELL